MRRLERASLLVVMLLIGLAGVATGITLAWDTRAGSASDVSDGGAGSPPAPLRTQTREGVGHLERGPAVEAEGDCVAVFVDAYDLEPVGGLEVAIRRATGSEFFGTTDELGQLPIGKGRWKIAHLAPPYAAKVAEVEVGDPPTDRALVSVVASGELRVRVTSRDGMPLEGVVVAEAETGKRHGDLAPTSSHLTDAGGLARFRCLRGLARYSVSKAGFLSQAVTPAWDGLESDVVVVLERDGEEAIDLVCTDALGQSMVGVQVTAVRSGYRHVPTYLGMTDAAGRLQIAGWVLRSAQIYFEGSAFRSRVNAPSDVSRTGSEWRVVLPRRLSGGFDLVDAGSIGTLHWFVQSRGSVHGVAIPLQPIPLMAPGGDPAVRAELPSDAPVTVRCIADDGSEWHSDVQLSDSGWRMPVRLSPPNQQRTLTLVCTGGCIIGVRRLSGFLVEDAGSTLCKTMHHAEGRVARLRVPTQACALELVSDSGSTVLLSLREGAEDQLIDVTFHDVVSVEFHCRDKSGDTVSGVRLECRRIDGRSAPSSHDVWRMSQSNVGVAVLDSRGVARLTLEPGRYAIGLRHLLDNVGLESGLHVSPSVCAIERSVGIVPLVCDRVRRLSIVLQGAESMQVGTWRASIPGDPDFLLLGGDRAEFWIGDSAQTIEIKTEDGAFGAALEVPAGSKPRREAVTLRRM